jgi:hypothetical protein
VQASIQPRLNHNAILKSTIGAGETN